MRRMLMLLALLVTGCGEGKQGERGPAGPPGEFAVYEGAIVQSSDGSPTNVAVYNADHRPLLILVDQVDPTGTFWIQANAYAEDASDTPFVFAFALIYSDHVSIYAANARHYRVFAW